MSWKGWPIIVAAIAIASSGCGADSQSTGQPVGPPSAESRTIEKVRQAAVAGMFYPRTEKELAEQIDKYLADVEPVPIKNLRGMICPHAGYEYSGPVAAFAYKQLIGRDFDTVIVMAPSHYADFEGASIPDVDAYETPLGMVPLSPRADKLAAERPFVCNPPCNVSRPAWWRQSPKEVPPFGEDTPHTWEHSLEVQLPFLQKTLKDFSIVPVVFGRVDAGSAAKALAGALDEKTLVVASSDLSHFFPYDTAKQLDTSCIKAICDMDVERMQREDACGKLPILTLMHVAKIKGWQPKLLDYRNSGDVTGDKSGVVGYAAIAFFEPDDGESTENEEASSVIPDAKVESGELTPEEGEILLQLAAKTVNQVVTHGAEPSVHVADVPDALRQERACFVTLKKDGQLRGCIGSIFPQEPLCQAVVAKARSAATEDPRFPPVEQKELDQLEIEVSVLSIPQVLRFDSPEEILEKLRPHVDGVVLHVSGRQATYLPQVWEQLPDPQTFLRYLSQKAGLPPDGWKSPEAMVLTYQVQAFH